jgi:hypothetical protein
MNLSATKTLKNKNNQEQTMPIPSPARTQQIPKGTTVVSTTLREPTSLFAQPTDSAKGVYIQARTPLKVVEHRAGWHKVETLASPKARGWVSTTKGPTLAPQLSVPTCDSDYLEFDQVNGKAFTGPVKIKDINQGYLGDCYLISALAALAGSNPEAIQDAIKEGDEPGSYTVTLRRGIKIGSRTGPKSVKVNNWFPVTHGHMLYAQGSLKDKPRSKVEEFRKKKRPMWPAIIEKAIATMVGGYDKVENGFEGSVIEAFTGKTAGHYNLGKVGSEQNDGVVKLLKQAIRDGRPVAAATKDSKDYYIIPGFAANHVYVAVGHSKDKIVLRNPHDPRETKSLSVAKFNQAFERITVGS